MCPYIPDQQINTGSYFSTTVSIDPSRFLDVEVGSAEFRDLLVRLAEIINDTRLDVKTKESGYCLLEEFVTGRVFFNPASTDPLQLRPEFLKMVNVGALGAGVTNSPHGLTITSTWKWIEIIGAATDSITPQAYPVTFGSSSGMNNISVIVDGTNVVIDNQSGVAFTDCMITLRYLKY